MKDPRLDYLPVAPWPIVQECYGHNPNSAASRHLHPKPTCPQCDGSHEHVWVQGLVGTDTHYDEATRCLICGGRKCDFCSSRRHHEDPHILGGGTFRAIGA